MKAITLRLLVSTSYNGEQLQLAPHSLFERHGDLFVLALNTGKAWRDGSDRKLGLFKLAGLKNSRLLDEPFEPLPGYDPGLPRPDDLLVLTV